MWQRIDAQLYPPPVKIRGPLRHPTGLLHRLPEWERVPGKLFATPRPTWEAKKSRNSKSTDCPYRKLRSRLYPLHSQDFTIAAFLGDKLPSKTYLGRESGWEGRRSPMTAVTALKNKDFDTNVCRPANRHAHEALKCRRHILLSEPFGCAG